MSGGEQVEFNKEIVTRLLTDFYPGFYVGVEEVNSEGEARLVAIVTPSSPEVGSGVAWDAPLEGIYEQMAAEYKRLGDLGPKGMFQFFGDRAVAAVEAVLDRYTVAHLPYIEPALAA